MTDKLKDALARADAPIQQQDFKKQREDYETLKQAARKYAEVLPYIDRLLKIDLSSGDREKAALSVMNVRGNIAAIISEGEEG